MFSENGMSKTEAARMLWVSEKTLDRMRREGQVRAWKEGWAVRFDRGDVERLLHKRRELAGRGIGKRWWRKYLLSAKTADGEMGKRGSNGVQ